MVHVTNHKGKTYLMYIACECGKTLVVPNPDNWGMNIIGMLQFRCPCGKIINVPTIWKQE